MQLSPGLLMILLYQSIDDGCKIRGVSLDTRVYTSLARGFNIQVKK